MKIFYQLTPEQFFKGINEANKISVKPLFKRKAFWVFLALGIGFSVFLVWVNSRFDSIVDYIADVLGEDYQGDLDYLIGDLYQIAGLRTWGVAGFVAVFILALVIDQLLQRMRYFRNYSPYLMNNRLELQEQSLFHQTEASQAHYFYAKLYDIQVSRHFVLIFIERGLVIPIPKNAFESQEQINAFVDFVRAKLSKKELI